MSLIGTGEIRLGENFLFVQTVDQCFLKEKLLQNKPFYAKNTKMAGKGLFSDVIFLNLGH